jgi:putative RNA 2'-phosphotransferase
MGVMDERALVRRSKLLSKVLRHQPSLARLTLGGGGWVAVDDLLHGLRERAGVALTRVELDEIVANNNKQRFAYDETGTRIRASQGHSVEVDLQLTETAPPETLYHGTGAQTAASIQREGLRKMRRHHVHLSADIPTALKVGARHGRPVVFAVAAGEMSRAGAPFYRSDNGVWLVESVAPRYLTLISPIEGD